MSSFSQIYRDITKVDRSAFNLAAGLRSAALVAVPLLIGIVTGELAALIYTTLGALNLINSEVPKSQAPLRVLFVASFTEALAFGLGTLAQTTGYVVIPFVGLGVFAGLMLAIYPRYGFVASQTAIFFAIGARLSGGSVGVVDYRIFFALLGGLWATLGIAVHRLLGSRRIGSRGMVPAASTISSSGSGQTAAPVRRDTFTHAVIVGVASSVGLSIGILLGLNRDFWIIVTIVLALRPGVNTTLDYTVMIVVGTAIGAVAAAVVTLEVTAHYTLLVILFAIAVAFFSTRGMNFALSQIFVTPFIIVLLNIIFPGSWQLAGARVLDVLIGGAVSLATVYVLAVRGFLHATRQRAPSHA